MVRKTRFWYKVQKFSLSICGIVDVYAISEKKIYLGMKTIVSYFDSLIITIVYSQNTFYI